MTTLIERLRTFGGFRRVRLKPDNRDFSITLGRYQVAPSLRPRLKRIADKPYRTDVAKNCHAGCVAILRALGGPRAMAARKFFHVTVPWLAAQLGITKEQATTVLVYLEGELIERVAVELDHVGDPVRRKRRKNADGEWRSEPVQWRFCKWWRKALWALHRHQRLKSKSDLCKFYLFSMNRKKVAGKSLDNIEEENLTLQYADFGDGEPWDHAASPLKALPTRRSAVRVVVDTVLESVEGALDRMASVIRERASGKVAGCPSPIVEATSTAHVETADSEAPVRSAAQIALARVRARAETVVERRGVAVADDRLNAILMRVGF